MQNITSRLVFFFLLGLYGIYLAIAAFVSDFVYFLTGSRSGRVEIRAMDTQETSIKTKAGDTSIDETSSSRCPTQNKKET